MAKVVVYTCAYNAEKVIARTIESVINQTFTDFEYYILNNGSTDATGDIIASYCNKDGRLFQTDLYKNDLRHYGTMLRFLRRTRKDSADWITIIDADDTWSTNFLEKMVELGEKHRLPLVMSSYDQIDDSTGAILKHKSLDEDMIIKRKDYAKHFIAYRGFSLAMWGKLLALKQFFPKTAYPDNFHNNHFMYGDSYCVLSTWIGGTSKFGICSDATYNYYIHKSAYTLNNVEEVVKNFDDLYTISKDFLETRGEISNFNQNFLYAIYLTAVQDTANLVVSSSLNQAIKLKYIKIILSKPLLREVFIYNEINSEIENMVNREKILDNIINNIKSMGIEKEYQTLFDDIIKTYDSLTEIKEKVFFQTEYENIISGIQKLPYANQLKHIKSISTNRPVILYGAGKAVGIALNVCRKSGLNIGMLCDSNKKGVYEQGEFSLPIISPKELVDKYSDSSVIITSWKFENEIRNNLKSIGFSNNNVFSFYYPQRISPEIFRKNYYGGYRWAYSIYEDETSKQLVLDKIKSYLASEPLKPNTLESAYYESVIELGENDVLLDSTHNPNSTENVQMYVNKVNGKYKQIYMFVPENKSFVDLQKHVENLNDIKIYNAGLGKKNSKKTYHYDGYMASGFVSCKYFSTTGSPFYESKFKTEEKNVFSIDALINCGEIEYAPTFICLDIQGSEIDALKGAANLIREHKPKLAICAYHQVQDIYELPRIIKSLRNDYKFILRQHDYGYYETVLYAY